MIRLFGIRSCDSCRKAVKWLEQNDIDYQFVDLRRDGFSGADVDRWQESAGWENLLNKRSLTWRKIPRVDRDGLDAGRAAQLIQDHPTVMRRPLLECENRVLLGFDETEYLRFVDAH
ncbi:MAG: Spx/MgsR family RNA polymerase-binding regulatory protein [Gammaproteobacteria bacterium]|nr:Spx/MgsR family RNA polymerase-binding regulatory protein [Gammaproteobacteria bacterium]